MLIIDRTGRWQGNRKGIDKTSLESHSRNEVVDKVEYQKINICIFLQRDVDETH